MVETPYTLAMYRVKPGQEEMFVTAWDDLARTFTKLTQPPLWGTLIRSTSERSLFYSFGPWRSASHVQKMRDHPDAAAAFARIAATCVEMTPGNYEMVRHVDVGSEG
jgi:quinol monooxygenase YgiN